MEGPEKACHNQHKKKMVINIAMAKGGGGGGGCGGGLGGIIFLGGVLATAAVASALALKRRHQKTISHEKNNEQSSPTVSSETLQDSNNDEAIKGLQILVSDATPKRRYHKFSNGITRTALSKTDLTCSITAENLILSDEKTESEIDEGKGGAISIDEEVLLDKCSEKAVNSPSDSIVKKEEFPSQTIDNFLHFDPDIIKKQVPEMEIQVIKNQDATEATLVDQVISEDNHDTRVYFDRKLVQKDQNYDREITMELEQQETPSNVAQEKITIECSIQEDTEVHRKELVLPYSDNVSFNNDGKLNYSCEEGYPQIKSDEIIKRDKQIEALEGDQNKDDTEIVLNERKIEKCEQHDEDILTKQCDDISEIKQADQIASVSNGVENTFLDEPLPASEDRDSDIEVPNSLGIQHDLCHFDISSTIDAVQEHVAKELCGLEGIVEEDGAKELCGLEGIVEEDGLAIKLIEKQQCYDDDEGNAVGDITKAPETLHIDYTTVGDARIARMGDEAENAYDNEVDDYDDDAYEAIGEEEGLPTIQLIKKQQCDDDDDEGNIVGDSTQASEIISMDIVRAEDDPVAQMSNEAENAKSNEIDDYDGDGEGDDDDDDDYANEVNSAEKIEASLEGTGDSSVESSAETIWLAEGIQESSMVIKDIKLDDQKEERDSQDEETAEAEDNIYYKSIEDANIAATSNLKNNSNGKFELNFKEKCMMEFAAQHDLMLNSIKRRVLTGLVTILLWSLGFSYFGSPFMKLSLVMILAMILSRVQGFGRTP